MEGGSQVEDHLVEVVLLEERRFIQPLQFTSWSRILPGIITTITTLCGGRITRSNQCQNPARFL